MSQYRSRECKILLVEDDPSDLKLTMKALSASNSNIQLHIVRNGAEAIRFVKKEGPYQNASRPNLVLLDLNLPGIDGREVLALMKSDPSLKDIPVVVLSTSSFDKDVEYCKSLNVNSYIVKPSAYEDYSELILSVERLCQSPEVKV